MSDQDKMLHVYKDRYDSLLKTVPDLLKADKAIASALDAQQQKTVATSVIQIFSLTPDSFRTKSAELCDCLVRHNLATKGEAEILKAVMRSYADKDDALARRSLGMIAEMKPESRLMEMIKKNVEREIASDETQGDNDAPQTQAKKNRRKLWEVIGGIAGAIIGGIAGLIGGGNGFAGAALGWTIGKELGGVLHDALAPSGVVAMPDGRDCTPPWF